MTIRVLVEGARNQYDRMHRSRARLRDRYESSVAYDDDFYHALQDAWHLKDWIKNDFPTPLCPTNTRLSRRRIKAPLANSSI